jgi:hypothetical protein
LKRLCRRVRMFYTGMQRGMQIATDLWRRHVKPAWQRVLDPVRARFPAVRFLFHCYGKIEPIVPDIVEAGFHMLHPIQPECIALGSTYRQFGSRIALAATISARRTFPFQSPDTVRDEVRRLAQLVGSDRRAIRVPSNRIQSETPWPNILGLHGSLPPTAEPRRAQRRNSRTTLPDSAPIPMLRRQLAVTRSVSLRVGS